MEYLHLFLTFFRIGAFGFGGGYAMLPLIFQSVQEFGFMSAEEFANLVALSQVTPGPVAVNGATYVGFNFGGILGAAVATLGVAIPSFILVLLVVRFMNAFKDSKNLEAVFTGIRPATVGLIGSAVIILAETSIVNAPIFSEIFIKNVVGNVNLLPGLIFICTIVLVTKFKISPIKITIIMGVIGAFICG